jgi:biotin carboxyl carrier protein
VSPRLWGWSAAAAVCVAVVATAVWVAESGRRVDLRTLAAPDTTAAARVKRIDELGEDQAGIVLDVHAAERAGIETRALGPPTRAGNVTLAGTLAPDPARVTNVQAPIAGRLTAADAGWPALGDQVGAGQVIGQVSDARPVTAPRPGTVTRVGAQPGEIVQAGQLLLEVTDFSGLMARIVWPPGSPVPAPASVALAPTVGAAGGASSARAPTVVATLVGPAPETDSVTRAPVFLYRVPAVWRGARPGTPVVALLPARTGATRGTFVPSEAVVQWQGLAWAYVRRGGGQYVRERVDTRHRVDGGWLVVPGDPSGVGPGDTVVVRGAELLLSEEFRSRVTVGEDEDKR